MFDTFFNIYLYLIPVVVIIVGTALIIDYVKQNKKK